MAVLFLVSSAAVLGYYQVTVDPTKLAHRFDGIGAMDNGANSKLLHDYPEPQRSEILDHLFLPGRNGTAQLHVLKVSLGGDSRVSPGGSEAAYAHTRAEFEAGGVWTRGYTFWLMKEIFRLSYSRPSWVGGGFFFSLDSIDYNIRWLEHAKNVLGCKIDYMGMYNERYYGPTEARWIKQFRKELDNSTVSDTKLVAADMCCNEGWKIAKLMAADSELNASMAAIGAHYPATSQQVPALYHVDNTSNMPTEAALQLGTPLWASEDWVFGKTYAPVNAHRIASTTTGGWAGATVLASQLNGNYVFGTMTATNIWNALYGMYDAEFTEIVRHSLVYVESPWEGSYSLNPALQIVAHWTAFTQPGWHYVAKGHGTYALPHGGGTITTLVGTKGIRMKGEENSKPNGKGISEELVKDDTRELTIVIETMNATVAQHLQLHLINVVGQTINIGGSSSESGSGRRVEMLYAWKTVEGKIFVPQPDVRIMSNGSLHSLMLEPSSILTLSTIDVPRRTPLRKNQTTGENVLPAPFPLPYADSFDCVPAAGRVRAKKAVLPHGGLQRPLKRTQPVYQPEGMMRYLQELSGSFQVQPHRKGDGGASGDSTTGKGEGGFLQQSATSQVANTQWSASAFAVGMLGDSRWRDIAVAADVRLSILASGGANGGCKRGTVVHRHAGACTSQKSWMPYLSVQLKACVKGDVQQQWKLVDGNRAILTADGQHALSVQGGYDTGSNGVYDTNINADGSRGGTSSAAIVRPCSPQTAMVWGAEDTASGLASASASVTAEPSLSTITNVARTLCLTAPMPTPMPTLLDVGDTDVVAEEGFKEGEPTGTLCIKHLHTPDDLWQPVCQPFAGVCININHTSISEAGVHGYCFTVDRTGTWRLSYGLGVNNNADCKRTKGYGCEVTLQSGKLRRGGDGGGGGEGSDENGDGVSVWIKPAEWHALKLSKKGNKVTAFINGTRVAKYVDLMVARAGRSGVAGIVSAAIPGISFDNFRLETP
eukprot:gene2154-18151_t